MIGWFSIALIGWFILVIWWSYIYYKDMLEKEK